MNVKLYFLFIVFVAGLLSLVCCSKQDAEPEADIISYKIVNNSDLEPTVLIDYTDENGNVTKVNNPALPWEISFKPNFTEPQLLELNASCDCDMTAQILLNGKVVNDSTNYGISINYYYQ
jgi:hypothetical protein